MMASSIRKFAIRLAFGSGVCLLLLTASCKPTEQNYKQAYEKTVAGREESKRDSTIYGDMRRNMQHEIGSVEAGEHRASVVSAFVKVTDGVGADRAVLRKYCVAAGQFKQVFNARSMCERLVANGYPDAFVMQTGEPYYYVVAASYDELQPATDMLQRLSRDESLKLKDPMPMLVQPAQLR